jgi:peptidoglycan DL-endopeptidase CwlO
VHTPPSVRRIVRQRVVAVAVSVCAAGLLIGVTGSAGAAPAPTVSQVQAKITKLDAEMARLGEQYDQVKQQLQGTDQRLAVIRKEVGAYSARFSSLRQAVDDIAVTSYENGNLNSSIALLTSGDPQQILNQSSILLELSEADNAQINEFLGAARQLTASQALEQRTRAGILQLDRGLRKRLDQLKNLDSQEQMLLAQLTPAQQNGLGPGSGSTGGIKYTGPTSTQAERAVKFAYEQIGCPYEYGGTGPCRDGFDCSGLTMQAWAYAGVSIPRTSYEQESELPQVYLDPGDPAKYLQPGDILGFIGNGHVGLYVGNNELVDAPQTGLDVELVPLSGWYLDNLDGAVRP